MVVGAGGAVVGVVVVGVVGGGPIGTLVARRALARYLVHAEDVQSVQVDPMNVPFAFWSAIRK